MLDIVLEVNQTQSIDASKTILFDTKIKNYYGNNNYSDNYYSNDYNNNNNYFSDSNNNNHNNYSKHLLSPYYVPGPVLSSFHTLGL